MNYLAHLSLAYPDPVLIAGNYIGDLITYKESNELHSELVKGLKLHRWIDDFSNNSEPLTKMNKALHHVVHKYAPVATDIICDYLLYLSWEKHFKISFAEFSEYSYQSLSDYSNYMPDRIAAICRNMIRHQWLQQYQSLEGLEEVLKRTNQKTKFSVDLTLILPVLIKNQATFMQLFNLFYEDCKMQSTKWISLQNAEK